MNRVPQGRQPAEIIDFPRQLMEAKPQNKRGGRRDPLPSFTIIIPGYAKHQGALKTGHKRTWVKFERIASQELIVAGVPFLARALFYELVMISDEGRLSDMTFALLSRLTGMDYRPLQNALGSLTEKGLISVDSILASADGQVMSKGQASDEQVMSKGQASDEQGKSLDQPTNGADHGAPVSQSVSQKEPPTPKGVSARVKTRFQTKDTSPEFQAFMAEYPKNEDARKAWDVWQQIATSAEAVAAIMAGLARWKASDRWARGFVKVAFRWLQDGMWQEHPESAAAKLSDEKPKENMSRQEKAAAARDLWLSIKDNPDAYTDEQKVAAAVDAASHWPGNRLQIIARLDGWGLKGTFANADI